MRTILALLALLLAALPVRADQTSDDADAVESCMHDAWPRDVRALCVGVVSAPCQRAAGKETTVAMVHCLAREAGAWDTVMNRQFPELMQRAREVDAANSQANDSLDASAPALETAQRAWLIYRDSECRYAYASWGNGSFRPVAHSACLVDLTARRVVDFHARLVTGG